MHARHGLYRGTYMDAGVGSEGSNVDLGVFCAFLLASKVLDVTHEKLIELARLTLV